MKWAQPVGFMRIDGCTNHSFGMFWQGRRSALMYLSLMFADD
jgi:hypothetical protein